MVGVFAVGIVVPDPDRKTAMCSASGTKSGLVVSITAASSSWARIGHEPPIKGYIDNENQNPG